MYTGKEICQGCKKPGTEVPRVDKQSLCKSCNSLLRKGSAVEFEKSIEYTSVRDWVNGFSSIDSEDMCLDALANSLFRALDNKHAEVSKHGDSDRSQPHGGVHYKIPTKVFEPLNLFLREINKKVREIRNIKIEAEKYARQAVEVEKDNIFNEGIAKGRDLLFSLNNGEITVEDFNKRIKR